MLKKDNWLTPRRWLSQGSLDRWFLSFCFSILATDFPWCKTECILVLCSFQMRGRKSMWDWLTLCFGSTSFSLMGSRHWWTNSHTHHTHVREWGPSCNFPSVFFSIVIASMSRFVSKTRLLPVRSFDIVCNSACCCCCFCSVFLFCLLVCLFVFLCTCRNNSTHNHIGWYLTLSHPESW